MLSYRYMTDADIGAAAAIMHVYTHVDYESVETFLQGKLAGKIGQNGLQGLIASHRKKPVGFTTWQNEFDTANQLEKTPLATLDRLYTLPSDEYTGTNLIRQMVRLVEPERQIRVFSSPDARRHYRHWGFIDTSRNEGDLYEMRLSLYRAERWRLTMGRKPPVFTIPEPAFILSVTPNV